MKHYGKLTAAAAAGFMTLSAMGVAPVFAAETDQTATVTVNVTKNANAHNPVGTPTFTIAGANVAGMTPSNNAQAIYSGTEVPSGLTVSVAAFDHSSGLNSTTATATGAISINSDAFTNKAPGQYVYNVSLADIKTANEGATTTDGVEVGDTSFTVNVYKDNDGELLMTVVNNNNEGAAKNANLLFADNTYTTHTLTITKLITGNQSVSTHEFPFTVSIAGVDSGEENHNTTSTGSNLQVSANRATANLSNGESITIHGLSEADIAEISEDLSGKTGYVATYKVDDATDAASGNSTSVTTGTADHSVTFTNTKEGTVPTGILMSAAPYAGLIGLGGIFAGLFFRRKRED